MEHEVLIAGGGLVGASLARALGSVGARVALVESWRYGADDQPSYDDRAIALAQGSRLILEAMGLWQAIAAEAAPIERIHVSDRGRFGFARLDRRDEGVPALGYVVPARTLGQALAAALRDTPTVEIVSPAEVRDFGFEERTAWLEVTGEGVRARRLEGRLLVAADGARSLIRERLGIPTRMHDYGQTAVIANVTPGLEHRNVAYERFTETGPMAMLPMTGRRCALVWTCAADAADELLALPDEAFLERLQARFGWRLGRFERAGRRSAYPLSLVWARESVRPRLALIGNAAHSLHPIAGQGFNLGLRDVAALAEVLAGARREGRDFGDPRVLQAYADWRAGDQRRVVAFTDGLIRLFGPSRGPAACARDLGLLAFDLTPPAKRLFGRLAMGRAGRLPRLARGLPLAAPGPEWGA